MSDTQTSTGEPQAQQAAMSAEEPTEGAKRAVRLDEAGLLGIFDLFILLVRERWIIAGFVVLGVLLGCNAMRSRGLYAAATTVLPPQSSINSSLLGQFGAVGGMAGASAMGASFGGHISQDLYVSLLQSVSVEDAVIHRFALDKEYGLQTPQQSRNLLRGLCEIDGNGRDGLIRITLHDDNAKRAAELANGYVEEFKRFVEHLALTEAAQRRRFFETQLAQERVNLTQAEDSVRKMEQGSAGIEVDAQTRALVDSAATLRAQVAAKEVELQSIRTYAGPENVNLLRAQEELAGLRAQLAKVSNSGGDADNSLLVSRKDIPQSQINAMRAMRELKFHESLFQMLASQYQSARMSEASEGNPVQVVDPALPPELRSGLGKKMKLIYGFFLGLLAGVVFVIGRQAVRRLAREPLLLPKFAAFRAALRPRP